jgi:hypothetical protein
VKGRGFGLSATLTDMSRALTIAAALGTLGTLGCPLAVSDEYSVSQGTAGGAGGAPASVGSGGAGNAGGFGAQGNAGGAGGVGGAACPAGMADCDGIASNGCETSLALPESCGACERDCAGGTCSGDPPVCGPVTLTSQVGNARSLAVAGGFVYWTDSEAVEVRRVPTTGGAAMTVVDALGWPGGLAVDDTHVYYATLAAGWGRIERAPRDGGVAEVLAEGWGFPHDVVVDPTGVYVTDMENDVVLRVPLTGGSPLPLISGQNGPIPLSLMGDRLYYANAWAGQVAWVTKDGSQSAVLGQEDVWTPRGLSAHPDALVWTERDFDDDSAGNVVSMSPAGGQPVKLAVGQPRPHSAVTDGIDVYFTCSGLKTAGTGSVRKVPLAGGPVQILAPSEFSPRDLRLADGVLYFGTYDAIKRIVIE